MRTVDRAGIEVMDRDECLAALRADVVGRIGISAHGTPLVLPVNYVMDGESVVFRTGEGTKLSAAGRAPACFEIDGFDRSTRSGWSVLATGRLEEITSHDGSTFARLTELGVSPWIPTGRDHLMRLVPTRITGRRVQPAPVVAP
jgi:nitroimidazol reductase NimA-like FMN-containing flavoprotein (pyridoxamine 5'-phosphate oxidase superfamily)